MRNAARYVALVVLIGGVLAVGAGTASATPSPVAEQRAAADKADESLALLGRLLGEASAAGERAGTNAAS